MTVDAVGIKTDYAFKPSGFRTGWTVLGIEDSGGQRALLHYNPFTGTKSIPVDDGIPNEVILTTQEEAEILADKLMVMDETYWPPFNPCVARVEDGKVAELVYPPEE